MPEIFAVFGRFIGLAFECIAGILIMIRAVEGIVGIARTIVANRW